MNARSNDKQDAIIALREILKPGDTVHTILRHVSRSGMYRRISLVAIRDGQPLNIDWLCLRAGVGNRPRGRDEGLGVGGCGMDMGFALVYELSATLWPTGFGCVGERCRSNDHSNGDRDYMPHSESVIDRPSGNVHAAHSHWHNSGGYALRHSWM